MNDFDVVVIGGGIAGLWTLASLRDAGYRAVLFEKNCLGGGQTLASQGIIHGGTKYALTGKLTGSSEAVRVLPTRWKAHLAGQRFPDLRAARINTRHQWMWNAGSISSRISSFFASKVMSSRVQPVATSELPGFLQGHQVYQLDEPVLDVQSVVQVLAALNTGAIYQADVISVENRPDGVSMTARAGEDEFTITASCAVCSAGEGNEAIQTSPMQRRPLQMVMVKGELPELCGHIIEANANPRLTITSHRTLNSEIVWYLGGRLAEEGVALSATALIKRAKTELGGLLPKIDWQNKAWATFTIDRAEGARSDGKRPDEPVIRPQASCITVWPTKLVFAPVVADRVLENIQAMGVKAQAHTMPENTWPAAESGQYPWDTCDWRDEPI